MVDLGIPGTDLKFTTDPDEADIVDVTDPGETADSVMDAGESTVDAGVDLGRSAGETAQDITRGALIQAPMSAVKTAQRGEATWVTGDQAARGFQQVDEGITEGIDRSLETFGLEDNRVIGGARTAGDVLIGDTIRNVYGTTTGMDIEEGDADFETDAWALADTALTVGSLGSGAIASRGVSAGARGASKGLSKARDVFRIGDDAADAARAGARGSDEAADAARATARGGDETTDAARASDQLRDQLSLTTRDGSMADGTLRQLFGRSGDDGARLATDGGRSADDVVEATGRTVDDTPALPGRVADDAAEAGARSADESADAFRLADDAGEASARSSDDVAQATQRQVDEAIDGATRSRRARGGQANRAASRSRRSRAAQRGTRSSDEAAEAGARAGDDAAGAARRGSRSPRTRAGRTGARGADEGTSLGQRVRNALWGTRKRKAATIGGGGFLAAAGAEEAGLLDGLGLDSNPLANEDELEVETEDGRSLLLHHVEDLEPTQDHPGGGQLREVEEFDPDGSWSKTDGYTVLLDMAGSTVTILGPDGEPMQAEVSAAQVAQAANRADGGYYETDE